MNLTSCLMTVLIIAANVTYPSTHAPLAGSWRLNSGRTHYGPGVDARRSESMTCRDTKGLVSCRIASTRRDGSKVSGSFTARVGGAPGPVRGIDGMDRVILRRAGQALDATFLQGQTRVFRYRAFRSQDGASLIVVSIDPSSREVLTTVVVYDRVQVR